MDQAWRNLLHGQIEIKVSVMRGRTTGSLKGAWRHQIPRDSLLQQLGVSGICFFSAEERRKRGEALRGCRRPLCEAPWPGYPFWLTSSP